MQQTTLLTVTWSNEKEHDITKTTLYRSFKKFNPSVPFIHHHFHRNEYREMEGAFNRSFGAESAYLLYKIFLLRKVLNKVTTKNVIFCDANDVTCLADINELSGKFDLENNIIIGQEKNQWPTKEVKDTWPDYKDYPEGCISFLNSGMILTTKENYSKMLGVMVRDIMSKNIRTFNNDQGVYTYYYNGNYSPTIKLDTENTFTLNTFHRTYDEVKLENNRIVCKNNGATPVFIHDNGWNHGSPKFVNHFELKRYFLDHYPRLKDIQKDRPIHPTHQEYLFKLKETFNPKVIYDIGACVNHWTNIAKEVWPDAQYILFEAMEESEDLFVEDNDLYEIGVFSDTEKDVTFYKNVTFPGGNSYYMENQDHSSMANQLFDNPANQFVRRTKTIDNVVKYRNFPYPDLVKIDVQGCEIDILRGATEVLKHAEHLIVELQHVEYNKGAQLAKESIPIIEAMGFELVTPQFSPSSHADADYHFKKKIVDSTKFNILTTGVLGVDPLINYASNELCKTEIEKYFETTWTIVTHSLNSHNKCKTQAQNFKNLSVVIDENARKDRTSSTRKALLNIKEGEYIWMMPEGFIPSLDCASKISKLLEENSSIAIEGTKCSGLDHIIFLRPDDLTLNSNKSMLSFFNNIRKNGKAVPSEEVSMGCVVNTGEYKHEARSNMERLCILYWDLKYSFHKYTNVYEALLNKRKTTTSSLLEIGVAQGASLRTFRDFFPNAKIFGLDIYPESILNEPRIEVAIGNSSEVEPFLKLRKMNGDKNFDIIIDDGSHKLNDQIKSFEIAWPLLNKNGLYIIEDVNDEELLKNKLATIVPKNSVVTFDLRAQSGLVDSGVVLISK